MEHIYKGTQFFRRGKIVHLDQASHIFVCPKPDCEYVMTALSEEGVATIRDAHLLKCDPIELQAVRWKEAFETDVPPFVTRVLKGEETDV